MSYWPFREGEEDGFYAEDAFGNEVLWSRQYKSERICQLIEVLGSKADHISNLFTDPFRRELKVLNAYQAGYDFMIPASRQRLREDRRAQFESIENRYYGRREQ